MNRVSCPHCGMQNFAISAYCSRCERPLPRARADATPPPAATKPSPPRAPVRQAPPRPGRPPEAAAARLSMPAVPPPAPPVVEAVAPPPLPIELASVAPADQPRPAGPRLDELPEAVESVAGELDAAEVTEAAARLGGDGASIDVPVQPAALAQVALAHLVDVVIVVTGGLLTTAVTSLLLGVGPRLNGPILDRLADWLRVDPRPAVIGGAVMLAGGLVYSVLAGRVGRSFGRRLTGTILVRTSGRRLSWPLLVCRALLALVSLLCCGAGYYWALIDRWHRPWHDIACGVVLVRRRVKLDA